MNNNDKGRLSFLKLNFYVLNCLKKSIIYVLTYLLTDSKKTNSTKFDKRFEKKPPSEIEQIGYMIETQILEVSYRNDSLFTKLGTLSKRE